ncbi:hypothetical protein, partial [Escherichia coli]|uniref:hypothetical protein n=1 Tax=Escherichia coli TaxID=562 RepID=UPI001ADCF350
ILGRWWRYKWITFHPSLTLSIGPPPQRIFFAIRQEVHLSVAASVISPLTGLGCFAVLPLTGGPE